MTVQEALDREIRRLQQPIDEMNAKNDFVVSVVYTNLVNLQKSYKRILKDIKVKS